MAEKYHQAQLLGRSSPAEEQIFSNHVLLEGICKYLSTQDLLRTSLLSQAWFTESRKALTNSKRKHVMCIQIDYHSPCRTLVKFNDFLEEIHRTTDHSIIFNGIKLQYHGKHNSKYKCYNCLKNNWLAGAGVNNNEDGMGFQVGGWSRQHDQLIMDKIPQIFGNILGKIQLKYIHVDDSLAYYCPFACLIKWWIRERPENILELCFNQSSCYTFHDSESYVVFYTWLSSDRITNIFSNLEVFGTGMLYSNQEGEFCLPSIVAPSLKKVILSNDTHHPARHGFRIQPNFPRHVFTDLKIYMHAVKTTMSFIEEFHPKIEILKIDGHCNQSTITREDFFLLGRLVSATLKKLTCSSSILTLLVCGMNPPDEYGKMIKNKFPALEMLDLHCSLGADGLNWFNCIDFRHDFPTLTDVRLELVNIDSADQAVAYGDYGPDNSQTDVDRVKFIEYLSLKTESISRTSVECAKRWLNLFRHISHLDLKGMPFIYDSDDCSFRRLFGQIKTLQFLKEISISSADLSSFCLDDLILGTCSQIQERLRGMNLARIPLYRFSILDHNGLEKINIHAHRICTLRINDAGESVCYSNQNPDSFVVSSKIAKVICKHRPGFKFGLEIIGACIPECTSGFRPGGLRLEHLKPFATISTQQPPGIKFKRFWEIQFSNQDRASRSYCSIPLD